MLKAILVPVDGSTRSEAALDVAIPIARQHGALLEVVTVCETPLDPLSTSGTRAGDPLLEVEMRAAVAAYAEQMGRRLELDAPDLRTRAVLLEGRVVDALAGYIEDQGHDLVVMSTHGRTGASRFWLGSVADALVRVCSPPVLLLKEGSTAAPPDGGPLFSDVLIPISTTDASVGIIEPAVTLAGKSAHYHLFHVVEPIPLVSRSVLDVVSATHPEGSATLHAPRQAFDDASQRLDQLADGLRRQGLRVSTSVEIHPHPPEAILARVAGMRSPLIAMASRGNAAAGRLLLGSVADKVIRGATGPVLVRVPSGR